MRHDIMENDCINIIIDSRIDPCRWFKVMQYGAGLYNYTADQNNTDQIPPITAQTGDTGDITLLTEFKFNEDILYQDYNSKFPDQGGNEKLGKWYGRAPEFGDKMCSWILTDETNELIVRSNIRHAKHTERPNPSFDIPQQIKGRNVDAECPIIPTNKNNLSPNIKNKTNSRKTIYLINI